MTTSTRRRIPGLRTRRARRVEARTWSGIRVTTVPRTLIDLAAILDAEELARACHEARVKHGTRPEHVDAVAARHPNAPGAGKLRRVLHGDVHLILSKLEKRFLALLREDKLPLPVTNRPAGGRYIDCRWPELHLTVELDSYTYHASRHAWERDRRREREARARGDDFRRFTYGDVFDEPDMVLAELRPALTALGTAAPR